MVLIGIDPGFSFTGYCVLKKDNTKIIMLDYGYLKLPSSQSLSVRIGIFHSFFDQKITTVQPNAIALETPFLGKNVQNFLKLGYLRGILYLLADRYQLNLLEFTPRQIKQMVTGFGGAEKDQVARVMYTLFPALKIQEKSDVTDAIAVALSGIWYRPH